MLDIIVTYGLVNYNFVKWKLVHVNKHQLREML